MSTRQIFAWLIAAAVAAVAIPLLVPRAFPLFPMGWEVTAAEARAIALERIRGLGELPADPYVVVFRDGDFSLERRLLERFAAGDGEPPELLRRRLFGWEVRVYAADAPAPEWTWRVRVSPGGEVSMLRFDLPARQGGEGEAPEPAAARARAGDFLRQSGFDPGAFAEPQVRAEQLARRTDLSLRYPAREASDGLPPWGVEVRFVGDRLAGYQTWMEAPEGREDASPFEQYLLLYFGANILLFLLIGVLGVLFVRRYHHGEVGVNRALQIFLLVLGSGLLALALTAVPAAETMMQGILARSASTWLGLVLRAVFGALPLAVLAALAWAVGESVAHERWGGKLASFDALFHGAWRSVTVARASLRGLALGLLLLAALLGLALVSRGWGAFTLASAVVDMQLNPGGWSGLAQVGRLGLELPALLVVCLFFNAVFRRRLGVWMGGSLTVLVGMFLLLPAILPVPVLQGLPAWLLWTAVPVLAFWRWDLLTSLLTGLTAVGVLAVLPLVLAADPRLQLQGWVPLLALALPLLISARQLHGGREFVYHYEEVPPHVRRIAERERQRVELETAREIQSAILPLLPSRLAGFEIAHAYEPATEVGGDFYDVLALEDGRLAVAVGDVAGHGVSSGLVMSMVKSALAVQVTFDPEVHAVFGTLNRMVFQSARRRMLATLSYALLDRERRELVYASAGHILPYRVTAEGRVYELEGGAYPLGVRPTFAPAVRRERMEPGDYLVLLSDGLVEATPEQNDEPFGFERLEESLARHAGGTPEALMRGLLADLEDHTGGRPREDDVTVVAVRLPVL
ncbi:MAG TPA: PP2C family protein-serine/threonine phosphatase [Thermoanaerobaculia bacterium]|nr:PP2C family protein-serine/threonine phosphatase [Thermoanaerobaculia bacterium]